MNYCNLGTIVNFQTREKLMQIEDINLETEYLLLKLVIYKKSKEQKYLSPKDYNKA